MTDPTPSAAPQPSNATSARTAPAPTDRDAGVHSRLLATWRCRRAWLLLLAVVGLGLVADLASKHFAFRSIADSPLVISREQVLRTDHLGSLVPPHEPVVVVPRVLDLTLVLNPGAVFGMGAGRRWFFVAFTVLAVAFALWVFATWTRPKDRIAHIGLGLLLSGGLGNLYDRLVYGCVRDFLHPLPGAELPGGWRWPWGGREVWPYVSNIADLLLIIGILLLLWHTWRHGRHAPPKTAAAKPAS